MVQDTWGGEPNMGLGPLTPLGEPLLFVLVLLFVGHPLSGMGIDYIMILPLLSVSL